MNELEQSLCSAIQLAANSAVENSGLTKTIEATIVESADPAIGLYKVSYMGNTIEAYGDSSSSYEIGDKVIILIPEGDMTKSKKIISSSSPSGNQYASIDDSDYTRLVSDGYILNFNNIDLCSYTPTSLTIPFNNITFIRLLKEYIANGIRNFTFMANVQTKLDSRQKENDRGYYGIKLVIPVKIPSADSADGSYITSEVTATLDPRTMLGHVYDFRVATLQSIDFEFPENAIYNDELLPKLIVTVSNFAIANDKPDDIFFSNIQVRSLKEILLNKSGNALEIKASQGEFFVIAPGFDAIKTLTPVLRINGKPKDVNGYECYWYVKDARIKNISDDGYETHGGYGWYCLNDKKEIGTNEDGNNGFEWITDKYELEVKREDVITELTYKCVLVQKEFVIKTEIGIKNFQATYEIQLTVDNATGSTVFNKNYGNIDLVARAKRNVEDNQHITLRTSWQRYDSTGAAFYNDKEEGLPAISVINEDKIIDNETWKETKVSYPCSRVKDFNKIECTFIEENLDTGTSRNIGTKSIIVSTTELFDYTIVIEHDKFNYKYDAEGDSPRVASYDGPASSKVTEIDPISFIIINANGEELTDNDYGYCVVKWQIPKASMIIPKNPTGESNNYYFCEYIGKKNSDLYYDIKNSYDSKLRDNNVELTVEYKGTVLKESIPFHFSKEGQNGTNGTKFSAVITYDGYAYGEISHDHMGRTIYNKFLATAIHYGTDSGGTLRTGVFKPCIRLNQEEEVYNKIVDWNGNNVFEIKVYKDGELIRYPAEIYSVEWRMLDDKGTKSHFEINSSTGELSWKNWSSTSLYSGIFSPPSIEEDYEIYHPIADSDSPCNIIEAKVTIKSTATDTSREQCLYAFYPIDIIGGRIAEDENFDDTIYYNPMGIINGYDDVMYASDGTQPNYDNRYPFKIDDCFSFSDRDLTSYLVDNQYLKWYSYDANNFVEKSSTALEYNAKPANKYDNGKTQNVVVFTGEIHHNTSQEDSQWNEDIQDWVSEEDNEGIETDIDNLRQEIVDLEQDVINSRLYLNALEDFQKELDIGENLSYNNYIEKLNGSYNMLHYRSLLFSYLNELLKTLFTIERLNNNRIVTFVPSLANTKTFLEQIKDNLLHFGDPVVANRKTYNDIPNYLYSFGITELSYSEPFYISEYGLSKNNQLKSNVIYFNEVLTKYFTNLTIMKTYTSDLQYFTELRGLMNNYINNNNPLNILIDGITDEEVFYGQEFRDHKALITNLFNSVGAENAIDSYQIQNILDRFKSEHFIYKEQYYFNKYNDLKNKKSRRLQLKNLELQDLIGLSRFIYIQYYKSVHMYLNYYSMSNLNEWDGSKIKIDDDEQYVLAPMMGAGYKDIANKYTGLVMGITNIAHSYAGVPANSQRVGLLGMSHGEQSLFISAEDGSAVFGKSGSGQIILDPTSDAAMLYSMGYWKEYNSQTGLPLNYTKTNQKYKGALINLTESYIHLGENVYQVTTPVTDKDKLEALINSYFEKKNPIVGYFKLTDEAWSIYNDTYIDNNEKRVGTYIAASPTGYFIILAIDSSNYTVPDPKAITASVSGNQTTFSYEGPNLSYYSNKSYKQIAYQWNGSNWIDCTVGSKIVYYSNRTRTYPFAANPWIIEAGVLSPSYPYNVYGYGKIYSGQHETLKSTKPGFYLDNTGLSIGSKFKVEIFGEGDNADAVLTLGQGATNGTGKHWTINANQDGESFIGYNTTRFSTNNTQQVYLGTDGIKLGTKFWVNNQGDVTANNIVTTGGEIAGWRIASNVIYSPSGLVAMYSSGRFVGPQWELNDQGATFGLLTLNGTTGSITSAAGFTIDGNGFKLQKPGTNQPKLSFGTDGNLIVRGTVYASAGKFTGEIEASSGNIGDWIIQPQSSSGTAGIYYGEQDHGYYQAMVTPTTIRAARGIFGNLNLCIDSPYGGDIDAGNARFASIKIWKSTGGSGVPSAGDYKYFNWWIYKYIHATIGESYSESEVPTDNDKCIKDFVEGYVADYFENTIKSWCNNTFVTQTNALTRAIADNLYAAKTHSHSEYAASNHNHGSHSHSVTVSGTSYSTSSSWVQ